MFFIDTVHGMPGLDSYIQYITIISSYNKHNNEYIFFPLGCWLQKLACTVLTVCSFLYWIHIPPIINKYRGQGKMSSLMFGAGLKTRSNWEQVRYWANGFWDGSSVWERKIDREIEQEREREWERDKAVHVPNNHDTLLP